MPQTLVSDAVRVLILAWEYPPRVVGGLGRHVGALATALAATGHDVCVVTHGDKQDATDERSDGVRVVRAAVDPLAVDFTTESLLAWAQIAEHAMIRAALPVLRHWQPDVVHAHDWLAAQSAITLSAFADAPLIATCHASEGGRHQGWLPAPLNQAIHSVERWLARSATAVITCSTSMHAEAVRLFELNPDAVSVVPNGIDATRWQRRTGPSRTGQSRTGPSRTGQRDAVRARLNADGPLMVFAGRLVHEKGVDTLLAALPELRRRHPGLRLAIAGVGAYEPQLRARARALRVVRAIEWTGFLDEDELAAVVGAADIAVVPSLYEPFGIVALEAAAARTALVVADTGGLQDLAAAGVAAAAFAPGDVNGLVAAVSALLADPAQARRAVSTAARVVQRDYTWPAVAVRTTGVYTAAIADYERAGGSSAATR